MYRETALNHSVFIIGEVAKQILEYRVIITYVTMRRKQLRGNMRYTSLSSDGNPMSPAVGKFNMSPACRFLRAMSLAFNVFVLLVLS